MGFSDPEAKRSCAVVAAAVAPAGGRSVDFVRPRNGQLGGILDSLGSHKDEVLSANGAWSAATVRMLVGWMDSACKQFAWQRAGCWQLLHV